MYGGKIYGYSTRGHKRFFSCTLMCRAEGTGDYTLTVEEYNITLSRRVYDAMHTRRPPHLNKKIKTSNHLHANKK